MPVEKPTTYLYRIDVNGKVSLVDTAYNYGGFSREYVSDAYLSDSDVGEVYFTVSADVGEVLDRYEVELSKKLILRR